jgi:hypothetical protein
VKKLLSVLIYTLVLGALESNAESSSVPRVQIREWGPALEKVKQVYGQVSKDREDLRDLREKHIALFNAEAAKLHPNYLGLTPPITTDMISYINRIIDETARKMEPAPTPFEIFTMGSMARDESGFFTDLEIGILVAKKTPEVKKYFDRFAQLLSDRFFLLGEHPDVGGKGLRIDEADNAPLHLKWHSRFASAGQIDALLNEALLKRKFDKIPFEGSRIFLATPQEFAEYVNPVVLDDVTLKAAEDRYKARIEQLVEAAWQDQLKHIKKSKISDAQKAAIRSEIRTKIKETFDGVLKPLSRKEYTTAKSLKTLVRNIRHLYGDKRLFDEYLKDREVYLQGPPKKKNPFYQVNRRQEIAYDKNIEEMEKPLSDLTNPIHGTLGSSVDLKRQLYRFPEQVLTNLGFWYNLPVQNTLQILQEATKRGLFNQQFALQLQDTLNFITGLRLKEQAILRKQGFAIPASVEEWQDLKEELEENIQNLKALEAGLISLKRPQEDIDKTHEKLTKVESELLNLQKMKPLTVESILTRPEVIELNAKHLPVLKELYDRTLAFLKGDAAAYQHPSTTAPTTTPTLTSTPALLPRPAPQAIKVATTLSAAPAPNIEALKALARKALSLNPEERKKALQARDELRTLGIR